MLPAGAVVAGRTRESFAAKSYCSQIELVGGQAQFEDCTRLRIDQRADRLPARRGEFYRPPVPSRIALRNSFDDKCIFRFGFHSGNGPIPKALSGSRGVDRCRIRFDFHAMGVYVTLVDGRSRLFLPFLDAEFQSRCASASRALACDSFSGAAKATDRTAAVMRMTLASCNCGCETALFAAVVVRCRGLAPGQTAWIISALHAVNDITDRRAPHLGRGRT